MHPTVLAAEPGGDFTDINLATVVWTWVAFGITFLVLSTVAWPALAAKIEEREQRIAEGLRKAEEAEGRARLLMDEQMRILDAARKEAQGVLAVARVAAEQEATALVQSAQAAIAEERKRRKEEVAFERAKAVEELKQTAVDLTLLTSARLLGRGLDDEDHRRLAREMVEASLHHLPPADQSITSHPLVRAESPGGGALITGQHPGGVGAWP